MLTTGNQLKAARALIGMDQTDLSVRAGVNVNTIRNMEAAGSNQIAGRAQNVQTVQRILEVAGIEFLNHGKPGVRLAVNTDAPPSSQRELDGAWNFGREAYQDDPVSGLDRNPFTHGTDLYEAFENGFEEESRKGVD